MRPDSEQAAQPDGARTLYWLYQAHHAVRGEVARAFRERGYGVTSEQWSILAVLWQRRACSQRVLAEASGRDQPGVTRLVDALVAQGLVQRQPDPSDRRSKRVVLTDAGAAAHDQLAPIIDTIVQRALGHLDAAERDRLQSQLRQIVLALAPPTP